ncbi:unnamed protein product [Lasius platythorax]|uniref:Uncharacterized protein n=1 Tax=Lasius platythorax TaxID=488582 RepID=A0AAV2NPP5_9HYME
MERRSSTCGRLLPSLRYDTLIHQPDVGPVFSVTAARGGDSAFLHYPHVDHVGRLFSSPTTTGELTFRASSKSRSAVGGFGEQASVPRGSSGINILRGSFQQLCANTWHSSNRKLIVPL